MFLTNNLRVVLGAGTPDEGVLELFEDTLVDGVAELGHVGIASDDNRCVVVWNLAFGLGVYSD